MFRSTCFGHLHAHHQELTTTLTASGFTLERGGSSVVTMLLPPHSKVKPEAVNAVVSSWWWAWRCLKHVEQHKKSSNKLVELLPSGWLICLNCTMMHGPANVECYRKHLSGLKSYEKIFLSFCIRDTNYKLHVYIFCSTARVSNHWFLTE